MSEFEGWLETEFKTATARPPMMAPLPTQAAYRRAIDEPAARPHLARTLVSAFAFVAVVLGGVSAVAARTANPVDIIRQAAAALGACDGDLASGHFRTCLGEFTTSHLTPTPPPPPSPKPNPNPTPTPTVSPGPSPTSTPRPSTTPYPTSTSRPTTSPTPEVHHTPAPTPTATPPVPPSVLFSETFDEDAPDSPPPGWTTDSGGWTVSLDGSNHFLSPTGTGGNVTSLGNRHWMNYTFTGAVRIFSGSGDADFIFNYRDPSNYDYCGINGTDLVLGKVVGGTSMPITSETHTSGSPWTVIQIQTSGSGFSCTLVPGGVAHPLTGNDPGAGSGGGIGARGDGMVGFDEIQVTSGHPN